MWNRVFLGKVEPAAAIKNAQTEMARVSNLEFPTG